MVPAGARQIDGIGSAALLVGRKQLLRRLIDVELSIRGILRGFGLKVGAVTRKGFEARIRELATGQATLERIAEAMLSARAALKAEYEKLHKAVLASRRPRSGRSMQNRAIFSSVPRFKARAANCTGRAKDASRSTGGPPSRCEPAAAGRAPAPTCTAAQPIKTNEPGGGLCATVVTSPIQSRVVVASSCQPQWDRALFRLFGPSGKMSWWRLVGVRKIVSGCSS